MVPGGPGRRTTGAAGPGPAHIPAMALSLGLFADTGGVADDTLLRALSKTERERYRAIVDSRRRRRYLASRWLMRRHLGRELGRPGETLDIVYPAGQPPECRQTQRRLGLSHSDGVCLSLLGDTDTTPAGCDIETLRPRRSAPKTLAAPYFDPAETRSLRDTPDAERPQLFLRYWTLKEAYLKARGLGLDAGLAFPAFAFAPGLECLQGPVEASWSFASLTLSMSTGESTLALAAAGDSRPIRLLAYAPSRLPVAINEPWQTTTWRPPLDRS